MTGIVLRHPSGNLRQVSSNKHRPVSAAALAAVLCVSSLALASCNKSSSDAKPSPSASASAPASASASAKASATPTKKPTMVTNLDRIKVSGKDGKAPKVEGSWPLAIAKTQSKVLKKGDGEKVDKNATVKVNYLGVNGRSTPPTSVDPPWTSRCPMSSQDLRRVSPASTKAIASSS